MPAIPIQIAPGVNAVQTPALNSTGVTQSENLRWFQGLAQKVGGFKKFCQALVSPATLQEGRSAVALRAWAALSGIDYLAIAGENRISLFGADVVSDITPLTVNSKLPIALSTTAGSQVVTVTDPLNSPLANSWLRVGGPISVGGIIIDGSYAVMTVVDPTHYTITSSVAAAGNVADGGAARVFTTTVGSAVVSVTFANHGLFTGQVARVTDPVVVGGLTIESNYIATVIDPNTYTIIASSPANASASVTENGGNLFLTFLNPPLGGVQNTMEVEFVSLDNWGEFLLAIPKGEPVFVWMPENGPSPMQNVATAPQANTLGFVANQQQILVLCGSVNTGTGLFDPMLVRWSDAGDYTQFIPLPTNQAGSLRLQVGSAIIGALAVASGALIFTDIAVYTMIYEGLPLVFGIPQPIGLNCGLVGPKAVGVIGSAVFWVSREQFYVSAGGAAPQQLPCAIWDRVFKNLSPAFVRQTVCATNAYFNEVAWYVPQADGTIVKARVQLDSGQWDYTIFAVTDSGNRSAAIDQNVFGPPMGASPGGAVYQEETGTDADDMPLVWRLLTGIAMIAEGDQFTFFKQVRPDVKFANDPGTGPGTVMMKVFVYRNPQEAPRVKGPYPINARTRSIPCRGRGRGLQFEFSGSDFGSAPRLGKLTFTGQPDGKGG